MGCGDAGGGLLGGGKAEGAAEDPAATAGGASEMQGAAAGSGERQETTQTQEWAAAAGSAAHTRAGAPSPAALGRTQDVAGAFVSVSASGQDLNCGTSTAKGVMTLWFSLPV